jgi:hypothetical protein
MKPTCREETLNEYDLSLRKETLRSSQYPPTAASSAKDTESSSRRKDARPKEATKVKKPDPEEG